MEARSIYDNVLRDPSKIRNLIIYVFGSVDYELCRLDLYRYMFLPGVQQYVSFRPTSCHGSMFMLNIRFFQDPSKMYQKIHDLTYSFFLPDIIFYRDQSNTVCTRQFMTWWMF